jgi:hypothetical protein
VVVPKFFFHIEDGVQIRDEEGRDLPDIATAQRKAFEAAGQVIAGAGKSPWTGEEWTVTVADELDMTLFRLTFSGTLSPAIKQALNRW